MNTKLAGARLAFAAILFAAVPALAQNEFPTPTAGKMTTGVVEMCLNVSGQAVPITSGNCAGSLPVSVLASVSPFTPAASGARGTPFSVGLTDSSGTLPTNTGAVVVSNVGTTNPMYCNVNGVAATTSDQLIMPGSWFGFGIPATITTLHCISTGSTTTANMLGGSGLGAGAGGGSSGGGNATALAPLNAGAGTATQALVIGCQYLASPPGWTDTQQGAVRCDPDGALVAYAPTLTASGNVTTQNLNPNSGTATAGSTVATSLDGRGTCSVQVTGTYTGALSAQTSNDNSNWITQGGTPFLRESTGVYTATIPSAAQDLWTVDVGGRGYFRVTALAAVTGTAAVTISCAQGMGRVDIGNYASVQGRAASGAALSGNPLLMGASDGTNAQNLLVDGSGNLKTVVTQPTAANLNATVVGTGKTTTQSKVTISVTNTYQQALASSATRTGCLVQNPPSNTHTVFVFFGSAPADTTTSFQLSPGNAISCAIGGIAVATDAVQVTGTASDVVVVSSQ